MNKEATCPYCGYEESDSWELKIDNGDTVLHYCENCENEYKLTRDVEVTYSSEKLKE